MLLHSKTAQIIRIVATYGLLIGAVNFLHFQFFTVHVVFYDTLLDVMIAGGILLLGYFAWWRQRLSLTPSETVLSLIVGVLSGYIFAITVPTVIDRSLSIYILEKIGQRGGGIRQDSFDRVFKEEYLLEHKLVDIRLTEQVNSGTIRIKNGCVSLTDRGRQIIAFTRFYRKNLLPKHREVMGQLTDDLTDPFRQSSSNKGYECGDLSPKSLPLIGKVPG